MNDRKTANNILDRHKDGEEFSQSVIRTALRDTGDLATDGSPGMAQEIPQEGDGGGESRSIGLVAQNLVRLGEKAWSRRR